MRRFEGKVALITGAARGQGRSHAIPLASEGADIIALDVGTPAAASSASSSAASPATADDLARTAQEVTGLGAQVVTAHVDVRDYAAMTKAVGSAVTTLGRLDVVCANAGIYATGRAGTMEPEPDLQDVLPAFTAVNAIPVPWAEAQDVSRALAFLASDDARYITGVALPVDAGAMLK